MGVESHRLLDTDVCEGLPVLLVLDVSVFFLPPSELEHHWMRDRTGWGVGLVFL